MLEENSITNLFEIKYPIIQAGMIWCSGWRLASEVSNNGGLGLIGSGSMYPEVLLKHIQKCNRATDKPFGVNVPLLYPNIEEHIQHIINEKVPVVFTSAGNPKTWTQKLRDNGIKVVHVVSSVKFAEKAQNAGVDAVVAEGFEAGGHNGRDETTTMVLLPLVRKSIDIPLIAAGGIGNGKGILAAFALGADAVQIGSRFAASKESSAHDNFKKRIINSVEGDTRLSLKKLNPVRLLTNEFSEQVKEAEIRGASPEELQELLGKGRAKKGMFEGDLKEGELEIGQVAAQFDEVKSVHDIMKDLLIEYYYARQELNKSKFNLTDNI